MPARTAATTGTAPKRRVTKTKRPQVPTSPPVQVEVRIAGRIKFAAACYDVQLKSDDDGMVTLSASMNPVLMDAPPEQAPERFGVDPRDGTEVIEQVHSGRRT